VAVAAAETRSALSLTIDDEKMLLLYMQAA
jgi:hypothetical protein